MHAFFSGNQAKNGANDIEFLRNEVNSKVICYRKRAVKQCGSANEPFAGRNFLWHKYQTIADFWLIFLPAAGYRNNDDLNNAGSNGNYWSSSLNTDNPNNAWNVNFNSDNVNRNNNNRYYGQSVRPVVAQ